MMQLEIRNTPNGCIWQIYHCETQEEIDILTKVSRANAFMSQTVNPTITEPETWPGWRDDDCWTRLLAHYRETGGRVDSNVLPEDLREEKAIATE